MYYQVYYESGLIWVDGGGFAGAVIKNYERLGTNKKCQIASPTELGSLYSSIPVNTKPRDCTEILINESSVWVEAHKCLEVVMAVAAQEGVRCIEADVSNLELDGTRSCIRVRPKADKVITTTGVILTSGAQQ